MWHKGFNVWLVKYLYIPLGGKNNIFSILVVVSFVAFWHDHTINIIFWAVREQISNQPEDTPFAPLPEMFTSVDDIKRFFPGP
jgi:hypothetical protein